MSDDPLAEIDRTVSALQDPTRRQILLDFYVHQREWTTAEVAAAVGVHRTVAHAHLERLAALGYLIASQRRGTAGKPAKLYRLTDRQIELSYPIQAIRSAGRAVGPGIAHRRTGSPPPARPVVATVPRLSPSPHAHPSRCCVSSSRWGPTTSCPTATSWPGTASSVRHVSRPKTSCELHAGILEGAFREAGLTCVPKRTATLRRRAVPTGS